MILSKKYTYFVLFFTLFIFLINLNNAENEDLKLIKKLEKTWDIKKEAIINEDILKPIEREYDKVGSINGGFGCQQPGYTGQYCEYPICESSNNKHYDRDTVSVLVDFIHQPSCGKATPLFVDVSMFSFTIEIHADTYPQPDINIYDKNGTIVPPFSIDKTDPTKSIYQYQPQTPGVYQIIPETNSQVKSCFIYVSAIANSHVDIGFIPSTQYDKLPSDRSDFPQSNPYYNQLNTIVAHTINVRQPGHISTFFIFKDYNIISRPQKVNIRYGCEFDYYYNSLFCYENDYYFLKIEGYDYYGNSFSRIKAFVCLLNSNPPVPPTTPGPSSPKSCKNNGTLVKNNDGTSYCYCKNLFTSYDCSTRICLNNGVLLDDGTCLCNENFSGEHCEDIKCSPDSGYIPTQYINRPIFVIRTRQSMNSYTSQIIRQIRQIARDLENVQNEWFENFGVVTFNNNGSTFEYNSFDSVESFISYLNKISNSINTDGSCNDAVFSSITAAIEEFQPGGTSPIYVLTDALPSDLNYFDNINQLNSYYSAPIYFFVFQQSNCNPIDFYSQEYKKMEKLSEIFSGLVFPIYSNESTRFGQIFYNIMLNTYFKSELMYGNDVDTCVNLKHINTLAIDSQFDKLIIITTGNNLDVQLVTPEGDSKDVIPLYKLSHISVWNYAGLHSGQWQFSIIPHDTITSCSIRVYAVISPYGQLFAPYYKLRWGLTSDLNLDAPIKQPLVGMRNSLVAHLDNYNPIDSSKIDAELIIHSKKENGKNMSFASNGLWRDGCNYQIYFSQFECYIPDETLYFTIFVKDANNFNLQRAGSMYCASLHPTQKPPSSCYNGGFMLNNTCICPPMYTGKYCETPVCYNGGTPLSNHCSCPPLVIGDFCEMLTCEAEEETPEPFNKQQSLTFLLDITSTNSLLLKQLSIYCDVMLRDILSHDLEYIDTIYVYGFDEGSMAVPIGITDVDNLEMVNEFFSYAYNISLSASKSCVKGNVWQALNLARMMSEPNSQIFLFQSTLPLEDGSIIPVLSNKVQDQFIKNGLTLTSYIGAVGKSKYYCNGGPNSFKNIQELSEKTYQGDFLEVTSNDYMNIPKVIPSFVSSSIVYKKLYNDCKNNCSLYFPIDSRTQNLQVKVKGNVGGYSVTLIMPNQSIDTSSYGLIEDDLTGLTIIESRKECDEDWESLGPQYCMKYISKPSTWVDAHDYCLQNKAFLVDDMYPAKDSYLTRYQDEFNISNVWIGLTSLIPYSRGDWSWNRDPLPSVLLSPNLYHNWNPKADLNDPNKKCAYKAREWNTDDCTSLKPFICQKHKYQDDFSPYISETENLPPGIWNVYVTSTGLTTIEIRVQSKFRIHNGFLTDIHGDKVSVFGNSYSNNLRLGVHVNLINNNFLNTYIVNSRMFLFDNNTMIQAANYQPRELCTYQYISEIISCGDPEQSYESFYAITTGLDELGYTIQRYTTHTCVKEVKKCHHGVKYGGECYCDDDWTGELCNIPICQNNGTYNRNTNTCKCQIGYSGDTCNMPICFNRSLNKISRNGKIFALVIENTKRNLVAINSLRQNISSILKNVNRQWIVEYIYVLFDSKSKNPTTKRFYNVDDYVSSIQTIAPYDDTTSCNLPIFNALSTAIQQLDQQQSVIYIVTSSMPSDINNEFEFEKNLVKYGPQFFYHAIADEGDCFGNIHSDVYLRIQEYTIGSGGNLLTTSGEKLGLAFSVIYPSLYHGTPLSNPALYNTSCQNGLTLYVHVDKNISDVYFYIYGQYPTLTIISPTNQTLNPITLFSEQNGSPYRLYIYKITYLDDFGIYTINLLDNGPCHTQIRAVGSSELYYGFVPSDVTFPDIGKHLDNATTVPMNDYNQFVGSIVGDKASLTYVQMYNIDTHEYEYLKFYRRNNCTYNYYSDPFKCSSGKILLKFYAQDDSGFTIVREGMTMCINIIVPPTYGPTIETTTSSTNASTTPSLVFNTKSDIYLINDVSSNVPADKYAYTLTNFLIQFFSNFKISPNYVNVAFSAVPGDGNVYFSNPTFNTYFGIITLNSSINNSYYPIDPPQTPGQSYLYEALQMADNSNFLNTGYNPNYKPHIIIYLTTKSSPDNNAINESQNVKRNGKFKIIAIAYQPSNNTDALKRMSDCFYEAENEENLSNLSSKLANQVKIASDNGNEYQC
uniref:EGF-like domain-containing protein n=1 Tax=Strongyloides stercoralis TaxID=6248 RepID=A0A0K0ERA7_STRER